MESVLSFTFSGGWVPCKVHAALQTGTTLSVSASASEEPSVWALCQCPVWPSPCPTEAGPNHHVSSVPSPSTWLGPVLQKKDYLPALPRSSPSLFLEEKRSLLPLEDQSPPVLSAIFRFPCGCSLGLLLQCWSSLELTIFLFPLLSPFLPVFLLFFLLILLTHLTWCPSEPGSCCSWNLAIPCDHRNPLLNLFSFWLVNFVF